MTIGRREEEEEEEEHEEQPWRKMKQWLHPTLR